MARYRVRKGQVLSHEGDVLEEGVIIDLPLHVAEDSAVRGSIEQIDASGQAVLRDVAAITADLARFKAHEQVTLLEQAIAEHKTRGAELEQLLVDAKRQAEANAPKPEKAEGPKGKKTDAPSA